MMSDKRIQDELDRLEFTGEALIERKVREVADLVLRNDSVDVYRIPYYVPWMKTSHGYPRSWSNGSDVVTIELRLSPQLRMYPDSARLILEKQIREQIT